MIMKESDVLGVLDNGQRPEGRSPDSRFGDFDTPNLSFLEKKAAFHGCQRRLFLHRRARLGCCAASTLSPTP